jgi:hypothetical protein
MLNVKNFSPRFSSGPPPFPLDEDDMVESMKKARLNDDDDEDDNPTISPAAPLVPVEWEIKIGKGNVEGVVGRLDDIVVCAMDLGGGVIVGAGAKGSVWMWKGSTLGS